MRYYIIPRLKIILCWNPKVACTTLFSIILAKLGHNIIGNIHLDMLTPENIADGKYDIFKLTNETIDDWEICNYTAVCVTRNPYNRLISAIRQRSYALVNEHWFEKYKLKSVTIKNFIEVLKSQNYIESHFYPQSHNMIDKIMFDEIYDIDDISSFAKKHNLPYNNERIGGHATKYDAGNDTIYHETTLYDISTETSFNSNISNWFTTENIKMINELY